MNDPVAPLITNRAGTVRAAIYLIASRAVVRLMPFRLLRWTLGGWNNGNAGNAPGLENSTIDSTALASARRVERAAYRLPGESRCLPKAIALHWMLRRGGMPSRIVVAVHRHDRSADHAYHAWVEHAGRMLIGACDRDEYRSVMTFEHRPVAIAAANHI